MYGTRITTVPRAWIAQSQLIFHTYSHSHFADLRAYPPGKWIIPGDQAETHTGRSAKIRGPEQLPEDRSSSATGLAGLSLVTQLPFTWRFHLPQASCGAAKASQLVSGLQGWDNHLSRGYTPDQTQVKIYQEGGPQGGFNHPHLQWQLLDPEICPQDEPPEQTGADPAGSCAHSKRLCRQISVSKHIPTFPLRADRGGSLIRILERSGGEELSPK